MNEKNNLPIILEHAKMTINEAVNKVIESTNLPAFLLEGILCDVLSEVRKQKNLELLSVLNTNEEKEGE